MPTRRALAIVAVGSLFVGPSVSRDGRYLFFTSRRPKNTKIPRYRNTAREALGLVPDPERGDIDIYWLDTRYLDELRPAGRLAQDQPPVLEGPIPAP